MDWTPWISWTALALVGVDVFVLRIWLKSSIEKGVQHKFDQSIESLRAELRKSEERFKSELRTKETEIAALRDGVLSGRSQRQALLDKRRLEAVERVWQAIVALAPYKSVSATMAIVNFEAAAKKAQQHQGLREVFKMLIAHLAPTVDSPDRIAASEQPFVSPLAWAYLSAYQAIVFSAFLRAKLLEIGIENPGELLTTERVQELIKAALPHQMEYIKQVDAGAYYYLLDELETLLLEELRKMLEGADIDAVSVQQAATIMERVKEVTAANTQASAQAADVPT